MVIGIDKYQFVEIVQYVMIITKKELTSKERTEALDQMIKLALNTIINC